ncbi:MAG TPA: efflux RND transporter periplasmic adaptor subunit [Micropepsaceae bacterium]|jgi:RND family efflux transporter MFP subunit
MKHPLLRWILLVGALLVTAAVITIVVFPGLFGINERPAGEAEEEEIQGTATVTLATPTSGSLAPVALAYGTVASSPQNAFVIALMRDGVFKSVNVRDGDAVRAGQPIVTVTTAPANVAAFLQAKQAVDFAMQDLTRVERLFANKLATNDQLATAHKILADAQVQLDQQRMIGAGETEVTLRAPFDGVITGLMATPGDKVQANTTIATVAKRSDVVIELNLDPQDASKLAPGAAVRLTVSFGDGSEIAGKLTSIGASIDPMTHLVKAIANVPAANSAHLALGTTLLAHIDLPSVQGIVIPRMALLEDAKGSYVFTVSEGEAKRQDIKVLVETDDMAIIDGLDPALGTQVVISGNSELDDDTPVQVEGQPSAEAAPAAQAAAPVKEAKP